VADLLRRIEELKKKAPEISTVSERFTRPSPASRPSASANGNHPPAPAPATRTPSPAINEGEISSRWKEFLGEVRKRRISVGSVMDLTTLQGVQGNTIKIGCADAFQVETVVRNKEFLSQILHELFRVNARLEAVVNPGQAPVAAPDAPPSESTPLQDEHPIITALKRELGAEPL